MSIFSGWLKNANGDYVAPKTKTELVLNDDGTTLKDSLANKGKWELLYRTNKPMGELIISVDLTKYEKVAFALDRDYLLGLCECPINIWKNLPGSHALHTEYSGGIAYIHYISDTSIKVNSTNYGIAIYGII